MQPITHKRPGMLQQQPQRRVNQQQQQSSGSGEFQPRHAPQLGQPGFARHGQPAVSGSPQPV